MRLVVSGFSRTFVLAVVVTCAAVLVHGQGAPRNSPPLPALPQTLFTSELQIRVSAVATGLSHPWSLAFLPGGDALVTERTGKLRIIRGGVLDPTPIAGVPAVRAQVLGGLLEVALHPRFAQNQWLYLTYTKAREDGLTTTALARAKFDDGAKDTADQRRSVVSRLSATHG